MLLSGVTVFISQSITSYGPPIWKMFLLWNSNMKNVFTCYNFSCNRKIIKIKDGFSSLRQCFARKSPLKVIKILFFTLKALVVLKIFKFLSWILVMSKNALIRKIRLKIKIYDVTTWLANNCNTHIAQYLKQ